MRLTLLTRRDCHLCQEAAALLQKEGIEFEAVDIDLDASLTRLYDEAIPVILSGDREVARAPITRESLRRGLARLGRA